MVLVDLAAPANSSGHSLAIWSGANRHIGWRSYPQDLSTDSVNNL